MKKILTLLACAGGVFAGTTACPSGTFGVGFSSSAQLSSVTDGGCVSVDQSFSNLAIQATGITSGDSDASGSGSDVAQTIPLSTVAGNAANASADSFVGGFGATATPMPSFDENLVTLSGVNIAAGASNNIVVTGVACSAVSGFASSAAFTGCSASGGVNLGSTTLTFSSANGVSGSPAVPVQLPSSVSSISTPLISTSLGPLLAAPEPSSFFLLSSALVGIGFLKLRGRRKSAKS